MVLEGEKITFGLDIGTRNVVGVVGYKEEGQFNIIDVEEVEHEARAMIDGQIHNIMKVAETIKKVKVALEERLEISLSTVSIAAAGRVLKTSVVTEYIDFDEEVMITKEIIQSLQLRGVEKAQEEIKQNDGQQFFCVGYSIIKYYLDDYEMENLEAHRGKKVGVHLLATFLPQIVIDSLYTAVDKVGLSVEHLSLEPIAAINAAIPKSYRLLNLALVDIGAGTSDIAITKDGSVMAYGMIPVAGDEMTEQIIHKYLVDFHTAEQIKRQLKDKESITYKDILGFTHEVKCEEVLKLLKKTMEELSAKIKAKMMELNGGKAPNAVFCVGGGGLIPGLTEIIAAELELPSERVVLKNSQDIQDVIDHTTHIKTPAMVTPVGICLTSLEEQGKNLIEVLVNDKKLNLLRARQLTVMDAALKVGLTHKELMPRKGKNFSATINGKKVRKLGSYGEAATIYVNNKEANLNSLIEDGDYIVIKEAINGVDAHYKLNEYIEANSYSISIEGQTVTIHPLCYRGDELLSKEAFLEQDDMINVKLPETMEELLEYLGIEYNGPILVNQRKSYVGYTVVEGDHIQLQREEENAPHQELSTYGEPTTDRDASVAKSIAFNQPINAQVEKPPVLEEIALSNQGGTYENEIWVTANGDPILLNNKRDYIFVDIFEFYSFDLSRPKGKIKLKLNGKDAAYTDSLKHQDVLSIYWE